MVSKLFDNPRLGRSVDSTINNIGKGVDDLRELEAVAKNNFLLRGYFNKKKKSTKTIKINYLSFHSVNTLFHVII